MTTATSDLVVLLDVDNTLIDNELLRERLEGALAGVLSAEESTRFWEIYETVRQETDFVNFPEAIERFGRECADQSCVNEVSGVLYDFPFRDFVYAQSFDVVRHVASFATPVILSDGDQLFQRHKIRSAGLEEAVGGRVLVFVHKEQEVENIRRLFPARHYVLVDDKPRIHGAMKDAMKGELTSVMVLQGRYALDASADELAQARPDIKVDGIGDLLSLDAARLSVARP